MGLRSPKISVRFSCGGTDQARGMSSWRPVDVNKRIWDMCRKFICSVQWL